MSVQQREKERRERGREALHQAACSSSSSRLRLPLFPFHHRQSSVPPLKRQDRERLVHLRPEASSLRIISVEGGAGGTPQLLSCVRTQSSGLPLGTTSTSSRIRGDGAAWWSSRQSWGFDEGTGSPSLEVGTAVFFRLGPGCRKRRGD
ncbi:hypothetical protein FQA47_023687 [Oryzias melastigma]|uniref:Uncharacterized protein n=1 Tax=Oryzias melastigma TaxID=30732 RepID=A0A834L178_ORYME|nr:hypothetical protein FQA47_023687 [Oryzias melastigma]